MSNDSGAGGVIGTLAGMAMLYWVAIALASAYVIAIMGVAVAGIAIVAALFGLYAYAKKARQAAIDNDREEIFRLMVAPMFVPVGILLGLFVTGVLGLTTFTVFFERLTTDYVPAGPMSLFFSLLFVIAAPFAVMFWLLIGGWLLAAFYSYSKESYGDWKPAAWAWFAWGLSWPLVHNFAEAPF